MKSELKYRGVVKKKDCYAARFRIEGRSYVIGGFQTAEDAAHYYDRVMLAIKGPAVYLNNPIEVYLPYLEETAGVPSRDQLRELLKGDFL